MDEATFNAPKESVLFKGKIGLIYPNSLAKSPTFCK